MNQKRIRQHYTKEFKSDAVKLVLEHGYSANEAAGVWESIKPMFPVGSVNTARTTNHLSKAVRPAASWNLRSSACAKKTSGCKWSVRS